VSSAKKKAKKSKSAKKSPKKTTKKKEKTPKAMDGKIEKLLAPYKMKNANGKVNWSGTILAAALQNADLKKLLLKKGMLMHTSKSGEYAAKPFESDLAESMGKRKGRLSGFAREKIAATKLQAAKLIEENNRHALKAMAAVKAHVVQMKAQMVKREKAVEEAAQKKEIAAVKLIEGKATLALNAANVASKLAAKKGSAAAKNPSAKKNNKPLTVKGLETKLSSDKASAEAAAHRWRADAHRLASIENEKAHKAKILMTAGREKTQKKVKRMLRQEKKQEGGMAGVAKMAKTAEKEAKINAKHSQQVTQAFANVPTITDPAKTKAEKKADTQDTVADTKKQAAKSSNNHLPAKGDSPKVAAIKAKLSKAKSALLAAKSDAKARAAQSQMNVAKSALDTPTSV
jgi:hypothetical protein